LRQLTRRPGAVQRTDSNVVETVHVQLRPRNAWRQVRSLRKHLTSRVRWASARALAIVHAGDLPPRLHAAADLRHVAAGGAAAAWSALRRAGE